MKKGNRKIHHRAANVIRQMFAKKQPHARVAAGDAEAVASEETGDPSAATEFQVAAQGERGGGGKANSASDEQARHPSPYERQQLRLTRLLTVATIVIAVATVIYMIFSGLQLREIKSSSEETRKLAEASGRGANAATEQANAMRGQLDTMNQQANSMREQTNTMNKSLDLTNRAVSAGEKQAKTSQVSARAAEESAKTARQSFEIGERPYVITAGLTLNSLEVGKKPENVVTYVNAGRTPASKVQVSVHLTITGEPAFRPNFNLPVIKAEPFLAAGKEITTHIFASWEPSQEWIEQIKTGKLRVYVYGTISYENGLGKRYPTEFFSFVYDPKVSGFDYYPPPE